MKHTPGPWHLKMGKSTWAPDEPDYPVAVVGANGEAVRFAHVTISSGYECTANARLIAEAPEMLEVLHAFLLEDGRDEDDPVLIAIKHRAWAILGRVDAA